MAPLGQWIAIIGFGFVGVIAVFNKRKWRIIPLLIYTSLSLEIIILAVFVARTHLPLLKRNDSWHYSELSLQGYELVTVSNLLEIKKQISEELYV